MEKQQLVVLLEGSEMRGTVSGRSFPDHFRDDPVTLLDVLPEHICRLLIIKKTAPIIAQFGVYNTYDCGPHDSGIPRP